MAYQLPYLITPPEHLLVHYNWSTLVYYVVKALSICTVKYQ